MADETGLSERLREFGNQEAGVIAAEFTGWVEESVKGESPLPLTDLQALVDFCAGQSGYWGVEWLFSPAASPATAAEYEMQSWDRQWERWSKLLVEAEPWAGKTLLSRKNDAFFQHLQNRRVAFNKGRFLQQIVSYLLPKFSVALKNLGCKGLATSCYAAAFYPKGTVGRP